MASTCSFPMQRWTERLAIPVFGCFVSIKRQGHLRGCCGFLGRRASLVNAVQESAVTSATGDVRLPSVSVSELPYLQFEVWLLYGRQPIRSQGEARIQEVEIGRHGLQIQRGQARGLLLPGVAQDHDLDAEEFLQQVCIKAGLPPTAWREDDALLSTFEGLVVRGEFDRSVLLTPAGGGQPRFQDEELEKLVQFCRDNVLAISRGAVPNYYLAGCSDGSVHGINLQVEVAGRRDPLQLERLSLRKPVPVQASLYQLCETAGHRLRRRRPAATDSQRCADPSGFARRSGRSWDGGGTGPGRPGSGATGTPGQPRCQVGLDVRSRRPAPKNCSEQPPSGLQVTLPESAAVHSFLAQVNRVPMIVGERAAVPARVPPCVRRLSRACSIRRRPDSCPTCWIS